MGLNVGQKPNKVCFQKKYLLDFIRNWRRQIKTNWRQCLKLPKVKLPRGDRTQVVNFKASYLTKYQSDFAHSSRNGPQRMQKGKISVTGNRTLVSRVTGGDTSHYTMTDVVEMSRYNKNYKIYFFYFFRHHCQGMVTTKLLFLP